MRWRFSCLFVALVTIACVSPSDAAAQTTVLTAPTRRASLSAIESAIRTTYVLPELRAQLVNKLESEQQAGRYDTSDPNAFAQRVNDDMASIAHDGHLYLDYDPV